MSAHGAAMSAHTPGPWVAECGGSISADGKVIATVQMGFQHNANLLAAAPELLAALRYVLDCAERDDFSDLQPVRDAIEQAVQS